MFVVFQNPAVRIFEDYFVNEDLYTGTKVANITFTQYLKSPGREDNSLVRSILCQKKGNISIDDFNKAEAFLKHQAFVSIANKYENIVQLFQARFRPNLDKQRVSKCIEDEYKTYLRQSRYLQENVLAHLRQMYRSNFYDFDIYHKFATDDD